MEIENNQATAENYDADATVDDGSCEYAQVEAANLFISEAAEGSSASPKPTSGAQPAPAAKPKEAVKNAK